MNPRIGERGIIWASVGGAPSPGLNLALSLTLASGPWSRRMARSFPVQAELGTSAKTYGNENRKILDMFRN